MVPVSKGEVHYFFWFCFVYVSLNLCLTVAMQKVNLWKVFVIMNIQAMSSAYILPEW